MSEVSHDLLGDETRPKHYKPGDLQCYQVGDSDWFAATSPEHAVDLANEMCGEGTYTIDQVELTGDAMLDRRWQEEDAPGVDAGSLREYLAAATGPEWLAGTEP